ncbi:unnamed protein product [Cochlearia groenlandica]
MWTVKPASIPGISQTPPRNHDGIRRRFCTFPMKSKTSESAGQQILLRSFESKRNKPISKEKEISGSDVLWAIQRAAAQKKQRSNADEKTTTKKKITSVELLSTVGESTEDNGVDYSNVRPLNIKSDWGQRLDEFEKLLKEFHDTEL